MAKQQTNSKLKRYTRPVSWVVYEDMETRKLHGVVNNHVDTEQWVRDQGFEIRGYPSEKSEMDACTYIEGLLPNIRSKKKGIKRK